MPFLACVNLFGVVVRIAPRATMRFAPDGPKNGSSLEDLFSEQVCRQATVPFTSSIFSRRKTSWVSRKSESKTARSGRRFSRPSVEHGIAGSDCPCRSGQLVGQRAGNDV